MSDRDTWRRRPHPEARRLGAIIAAEVRAQRRRILEQPDPSTTQDAEDPPA